VKNTLSSGKAGSEN